MSASITAVLEEFRKDVSDFVSAGVVHRQEGTSIASLQGEAAGSTDPQLGEAYLAEVFKLHERAQEALGREATTEDIVLSTSQGLLLARPLAESDYLWAVVVGAGANLSLTRAMMRRYHERVQEALP